MSPTLKNALLIGAAVIMLGFAAYRFLFSGGAEAKFPSEYTVQAVCLETQENLQIKYKPDQIAPFVNPKTGKRTVYPWYFCLTCKYKFVPDLVPAPDGGPPRMPVVPTCKHCGGQKAGSWNPQDPEEATPAGVCELPKLPK
jgi:hypothetical protein